MMTSKELAEKAIDVAKNYKTLYVMGCFGWPMTAANKKRIIAECEYNRRPERKAMIEAATSQVTGWDCCNLIKGLIWGWNGDLTKSYGGAKYDTAVCPDIGANAMITACKDVKTSDWDKIEVGEAVWLEGHIGIYVGNGLVAEASPRWENSVQLTGLGNIGGIKGYNNRTWKRHGKLPWVSYEKTTEAKPKPGKKAKFEVGDVVKFNGDTHYTNAWANSGFKTRPGNAKITIIREDGKHPYHVIHTDSASNVYGWVDAKDIKEA